jgi:ankyrin repeat protein
MALINHGAEPAVKTNEGNDALHFAMQKGNTRSAEILKKYANK